MKKLLYIVTAFILTGMMAPQTTVAQIETEDTVLEIYYTHSTNRCAGCRAIEDQTVETLNNGFKADLATGKIKYTAINIDDADNKEFVKKYEVWGSSLFIVKKGTEETIDLTRDGFAFARSRPEMFREKLSEAIRNNLN
jgi:hypothetical protein